MHFLQKTKKCMEKSNAPWYNTFDFGIFHHSSRKGVACVPKKTESGLIGSSHELKLEAKTNMNMLRWLDNAILVLIVLWFLDVFGVFKIDKVLYSAMTVSCTMVLFVPRIIGNIFGLGRPWMKYLTLVSFVTAVTLAGTVVTYHAVIVFTLPLVLAGQYRSKRVLYITCALTILGMFISTICGYYWGVCDANMLLLTKYTTSYYLQEFADGTLGSVTLNASPFATLSLFFVLPRAIMILCFVPVIRSVAKERAENAVRITFLQQEGEVDKSTRFYNKSKFQQMVAGYYSQIDRVGTIFFDINNLKVINDTYGHSQGDFIIATLANCMLVLADERRKNYRIGGDEFVMMIESPQEGEIDEILSKLQQLIDDSNETSRIPLSVAFGHAEGKGSEIRALIERADAEMYHKKRQRGDRADALSAPAVNLLGDRLFDAIASVSDHVYVFMCDMGTQMSRWSSSAVEYFDLPNEYMKNAGEIWIDRIHPDDRAAYREDIEKVFSGKARRHACEYRARNKSGEYVWLECRGCVVYDELRQTQFFAGIITRLDAKNKYDPLTKMCAYFGNSSEVYDKGFGSLLLIGLDDFRKVVNNFGYAFGDTVLTEFATRLMHYCGATRKPYRLEGDEFLIDSPNESREGTVRMFEELKQLGIALGKESGHPVNLQFSGGAVLYPENGTKRSDLIGCLEHSLESAKNNKRGELAFFSNDLARSHMRELMVKQVVTHSIRNDFEGFTLFFQPLVSSDDYKTVSCEALLRYKDWTQNGINIGDVVRIMEENGDIIPVGKWVICEAFRKAQKWQKEFPDLNVSLNVSMIQFREEGFVEYIIQKAEEFAIDPHRITIELTESSDVDDLQSMGEYLRRLREFGFKIALDDFGIAYSTLLILKALPTDIVKIDHNFVLHLNKQGNETDLAIIEAVIGLCKNLNIEVVAEGVENQEILDILKKYPITRFQGYHFNRPMPEENFEEVLRKEETEE